MKQIEAFLKESGSYKFDVNKWGSCQYSGALAMYNAYFLKRKTHSKSAILGYLEYEFNYIISFDNIRNDENAIIEYFNIFNKLRKWNMKNLIDYNILEKLDKNDQEIIWNIRRACSGDDLFFIGRNSSSDLWHTALKIANAYFVNLKIENTPNCENPIGIETGPIGNICAQADNIQTGICCALLIDYEIVKNEKSFRKFDT